MNNTTGKLTVVATPIGNLGDMVPRAVEVLQSVDLIAAEDTRRTGQLCSHFDIRTPLVSYHDHNEAKEAQRLVAQMQEGKNVALVSDAGTPLVSDPGYRLLRLARECGIEVSVVPGACAAIAALSGAGLPSDRFSFVGFPPAKEQARQQWLESLSGRAETLIFYESTHRIVASLKSVFAIIGSTRKIVLAREITKQYETWLTGTVAEVLEQVELDTNQQRGEFVVVLEGSMIEQTSCDQEIVRYLKVLIQEMPMKKAAALAAELLGERKNHCYQVGLDAGL